MTEVEQIARETWAAMVQRTDVEQGGRAVHPMPPDIALDRVQDVTDDRDEAVSELCRAAASWLAGERVVFVLRGVSGGTHAACRDAADMVQSYVRGEVLGSASLWLGNIRELCLRAAATDSQVENRAASHWMIWAGKAERAVRLVGELGRAAHPEAA